jgi:hypothetical protein
MAKESNTTFIFMASKKLQQLLIALLFIAMGIMGFASSSGTTSLLSREFSSLFGGDRELVLYLISSLVLFFGIFLVAQLFVSKIPVKFTNISLKVIFVFWIALIVILDVMTVNFSGFRGSDWFAWIEQVVLHLIVLISIAQIQK